MFSSPRTLTIPEREEEIERLGRPFKRSVDAYEKWAEARTEPDDHGELLVLLREMRRGLEPLRVEADRIYQLSLGKNGMPLAVRNRGRIVDDAVDLKLSAKRLDDAIRKVERRLRGAGGAR